MNHSTGKFSQRRDGVIDHTSAATASPATVDSLYELAQALLAKVAALREAQLAEPLRPRSTAMPGAQTFDFYDEVRSFEVLLIRDALIQCDGCQRAAAQLLGLKYTTLNYKVKSYGIRINKLLNGSPELKLARQHYDGRASAEALDRPAAPLRVQLDRPDPIAPAFASEARLPARAR